MVPDTGETPRAEFTPVQQNWNWFGFSCASSPTCTLLEGCWALRGMERERSHAITHAVISVYSRLFKRLLQQRPLWNASQAGCEAEFECGSCPVAGQRLFYPWSLQITHCT